MAKKSSGTNYVQMYKKYPDVVSMQQVCEMLNIGRNYAYRLIRSGKLKRMDDCRIIRVTKNAVIEYAEQNPQLFDKSPV